MPNWELVVTLFSVAQAHIDPELPSGITRRFYGITCGHRHYLAVAGTHLIGCMSAEKHTEEPANPPPAPSRSKAKTAAPAASCLLYAALLALLSAANALGPERWWWSTLNLYLPQWIWGVPGLALLIVFLRIARQHLWIPAALLLWVAGPLMGFRWSLAAPRTTGSGVRLRVMTYNIKWKTCDVHACIEQIRADNPDILLLQDASGAVETGLAELLPEWRFGGNGQYILGRRPWLQVIDERILSYPDELGHWLRCRIALGGRSATIYDVHLLSPRRGLQAMKAPNSGGIDDVEEDASARLEQVEVLARSLRHETGPVLVGGDMNAPVQSLVCRDLMDTGLRDAFDLSGCGYGYTYGHNSRLAHSYVRIDHVLLSKPWQALRCWTGEAPGSDHRPVIADLFLPDLGK